MHLGKYSVDHVGIKNNKFSIKSVRLSLTFNFKESVKFPDFVLIHSLSIIEIWFSRIHNKFILLNPGYPRVFYKLH